MASRLNIDFCTSSTSLGTNSALLDIQARGSLAGLTGHISVYTHSPPTDWDMISHISFSHPCFLDVMCPYHDEATQAFYHFLVTVDFRCLVIFSCRFTILFSLS
jgi:hypothetical protein